MVENTHWWVRLLVGCPHALIQIKSWVLARLTFSWLQFILLLLLAGIAEMMFLMITDNKPTINPKIFTRQSKSATEHLLGAAGGLGATFIILALKDRGAPPTLNLKVPDPAGEGIDFVADQPDPWRWPMRSPMASVLVA